LAPSGFTHSALLSAYEKCGQWERAVMFLTQLRALQEEAAAAVVRGAAAGAEPGRVAGVGKARGGAGTKRAGSAAVGAGAGAAAASAALPRSIVKEIHYNITMSACGKCGEAARAEILFREMQRHGRGLHWSIFQLNLSRS